MNKGGFFADIFDQFGFASARDYFGTVLGLKYSPLFPIQIVAAIGATVYAFTEKWIWTEPVAAYLIIAMDLLNARYGYLVAKEVKKEPFIFKKFMRTFSIITSSLMLLSMLHLAVKHGPIPAQVANVMWAWLYAYKLSSILDHWSALKIQEGKLKNMLLTFITNWMRTKMGQDVIDNVQKEDCKEKQVN